MAAPDVPGFESLPPALQVVIGAAVAIVTAIGAARSYWKQKHATPVQEMVVQSAAIIEAKPVLDLLQATKDGNVELREIRRVLDLILSHLHDIERERENDRRVEHDVKMALIEKAMKIRVE